MICRCGEELSADEDMIEKLCTLRTGRLEGKECDLAAIVYVRES